MRQGSGSQATQKYTSEVDTTIRLCLQYHGIHKYLRMDMMSVIKEVYKKLTIPEIIDDLTIKPDGELGFSSEDSLYPTHWLPYACESDNSNEREKLFINAINNFMDMEEFQEHDKLAKCLIELMITNQLNLGLLTPELYISNYCEIIPFINNWAQISRKGELVSHFTIHDPQKEINRAWIRIGGYTEDFIYSTTNNSWELVSWKPPYSALPLASIMADVVIYTDSVSVSEFAVKFVYHVLGTKQREKLVQNKVQITLSDGRKVTSGWLWGFSCGIL